MKLTFNQRQIDFSFCFLYLMLGTPSSFFSLDCVWSSLYLPFLTSIVKLPHLGILCIFSSYFFVFQFVSFIYFYFIFFTTKLFFSLNFSFILRILCKLQFPDFFYVSGFSALSYILFLFLSQYQKEIALVFLNLDIFLGCSQSQLQTVVDKICFAFLLFKSLNCSQLFIYLLIMHYYTFNIFSMELTCRNQLRLFQQFFQPSILQKSISGSKSKSFSPHQSLCTVVLNLFFLSIACFRRVLRNYTSFFLSLLRGGSFYLITLYLLETISWLSIQGPKYSCRDDEK